MLMDGIEPPTQEASTPRSTTELQQHCLVLLVGLEPTHKRVLNPSPLPIGIQEHCVWQTVKDLNPLNKVLEARPLAKAERSINWLPD